MAQMEEENDPINLNISENVKYQTLKSIYRRGGEYENPENN
jgi:hypothetical protein